MALKFAPKLIKTQTAVLGTGCMMEGKCDLTSEFGALSKNERTSSSLLQKVRAANGGLLLEEATDKVASFRATNRITNSSK